VVVEGKGNKTNYESLPGRVKAPLPVAVAVRCHYSRSQIIIVALINETSRRFCFFCL